MKRAAAAGLLAGLAAGGAIAGVPVKVTATGRVTFNLVTLPPSAACRWERRPR